LRTSTGQPVSTRHSAGRSHQDQSPAAHGIEDRAVSTFRGIELAMNLDSPEQVDEALSTAVAAGGRLVHAGERTDWGYNGYFADPEGNVWEVAYNPGFPIGPDGRPTLP